MKTFSAIIAFIFVMMLFLPGQLNQEAMVKASDVSNQYHEAISSSCEDAAKAIMTFNDSYSTETGADGKKQDFKKIDLNLNAGLDRFYRSLYINLDIQDDYGQQQALFSQIPLIIATGYDGYYIHTWEETKVGDKYTVTNEWMNKKKYSVFDSKLNIKISYTLDDYVYIYDYNTKKTLEGDRKEFADDYPQYFSDDSFQKVKDQVINQMIKNDLEYYTYNCNRIAKQNGWQFNFNIPYWGNRNISTISFVAFCQGKIFQGQNRYDSYGFGTAKIVEKRQIYGYEENGYKYYSEHKDGNEVTAFNDEYDAAQNGYCPDPKYYK